MLSEAAEVYASKQKEDILDLLTPERYARFEQSLKEADEGKFIPHEEVIKISKQWLTK